MTEFWSEGREFCYFVPTSFVRATKDTDPQTIVDAYIDRQRMKKQLKPFPVYARAPYLDNPKADNEMLHAFDQRCGNTHWHLCEHSRGGERWRPIPTIGLMKITCDVCHRITYQIPGNHAKGDISLAMFYRKDLPRTGKSYNGFRIFINPGLNDFEKNLVPTRMVVNPKKQYLLKTGVPPPKVSVPKSGQSAPKTNANKPNPEPPRKVDAGKPHCRDGEWITGFINRPISKRRVYQIEALRCNGKKGKCGLAVRKEDSDYPLRFVTMKLGDRPKAEYISNIIYAIEMSRKHRPSNGAIAELHEAATKAGVEGAIKPEPNVVPDEKGKATQSYKMKVYINKEWQNRTFQQITTDQLAGFLRIPTTVFVCQYRSMSYFMNTVRDAEGSYVCNDTVRWEHLAEGIRHATAAYFREAGAKQVAPPTPTSLVHHPDTPSQKEHQSGTKTSHESLAQRILSPCPKPPGRTDQGIPLRHKYSRKSYCPGCNCTAVNFAKLNNHLDTTYCYRCHEEWYVVMGRRAWYRGQSS